MDIKQRLLKISRVMGSTESSGKPIIQFQLQIFKQAIIASIICAALFAVYFLLTDVIFAVAVFGANILIFITCYYLAKRHDPKLGTSLFLISVTLTTCLFMWRSEGLNDEAVMAFPCFLVFAMLISSFTLAKWLLFIVCCNILLNGLANQYGVYTNRVEPSDLNTAMVLVIVLVAVSAGVYLAFINMQKLMAELAAENQKVTQSKQKIIHLQNHDPLTGLPNRTMAEMVVNERLAVDAKTELETHLLFIDFDNFKTINDTLGHACGDMVLKIVAQRLLGCVRETDTVCRFGGDEFVIVATQATEQAQVHFSGLAEKILQVVSEPIKLGANNIAPTVSIGIAVSPSQASSFAELYQKADLAMYSTKRAGRNGYQFFNADMNINSARQLRLSQDLRAALANNEFRLHYQSTQHINSNEIVAAEALIRWKHPELGEISPSEFIPIAEQSGFIGEIGYWVLREAVGACKSWHNQGFTKLKIAVNVSAIQFYREHFEDKIQEVLEEHDLAGKYLVLELTESVFFDMQHNFSRVLSTFEALNVRVAIDDFGTGYSNLGYLNQNEISVLKIDRSFISNILRSPKDLAIVEMIVNMSKTLGMMVVAEGVETEQQKQALLKIGCTYGQGYFWSKPIDSNEFLKLVKQSQIITD